jgi:hypothetical protein
MKQNVLTGKHQTAEGTCMTVMEAPQKLGVSRRTINYLVEQGDLWLCNIHHNCKKRDKIAVVSIEQLLCAADAPDTAPLV